MNRVSFIRVWGSTYGTFDRKIDLSPKTVDDAEEQARRHVGPMFPLVSVEAHFENGDWAIRHFEYKSEVAQGGGLWTLWQADMPSLKSPRFSDVAAQVNP